MAINSTLTFALSSGSGSGGLQFNNSATVSSNLSTQFSEALAIAKSGTLTTRVSGTAGTLTMAGGHGITDGQRIDIYFATGIAYGATVGTVATNSVPFTLAQGDALPIATTAVTVQVPTSVPVVVTGNSVVSYGAGITLGDTGKVVFAASDNSTIAAISLTAAIPAAIWASGYTGTNPLADGSVTHVYISHASVTLTPTMTGLIQYN